MRSFIMIAASMVSIPVGAHANTTAAACKTETFVVFYDKDRAELPGPAAAVLDSAAASYRHCGQAHVSVTSFEPRVAAAADGDRALSMRRTRAALEYLAAKGVPGGAMTVAAKRGPAVRIAQADPENDILSRRVEITVGGKTDTPR